MRGSICSFAATLLREQDGALEATISALLESCGTTLLDTIFMVGHPQDPVGGAGGDSRFFCLWSLVLVGWSVGDALTVEAVGPRF